MILIIDNYDSFTYNLVQYAGMINKNILVKRNNQISLKEIQKLDPSHIIISPGPGRPENAGNSIEIIKLLGKYIPTLGVCLGHQAIAVAYDGKIKKSKEIVHGKTSKIFIKIESVLFSSIDNQFTATRYHSLIVDKHSLPIHINITSELSDGTIMSIEHEKDPVYGVQFHPESFATKEGFKIIKNFLDI